MLPTVMVADTSFVAVLMTDTVPLSPLVRYACLPSGARVTAPETLPALTGVPLVTYACLPSGLTVIPYGASPTRMGADTAPVAKVITTTVPSTLLSTYALPAHPPAAFASGRPP